jgi:hypothetical protein
MSISLLLDNIKMDALEIGLGGAKCIGLTQDRDKWKAVMNTVINIRVL